MNILVTGGAGYIGSHTCLVLAESGHTPVVYDNLSLGHREAVQWGPLVTGDLGDQETLRKTMKKFEIEAVMHFAANAYVGESVQNPQKYYKNNVKNSLSLLETMLEAGVKLFVFSSSCTIYGIPNTLPITEDSPKNPISPYGRSKLMVERVLEDYSKAYDLQYAALRYFNVIGNDPELRIGEAHSPETHLLPCVIQAALGQRPKLEVFGNDYPTPDGTAVRDYVHVLDLARGHVEALQWLRTHPGETLQVNFGTETGHSVLEIIRTTERVLDKPVPYILSARREGDPPSLVASSEQVRILLGWRPNYSLHESIEHVTQWFRKEGKF